MKKNVHRRGNNPRVFLYSVFYAHIHAHDQQSEWSFHNQSPLDKNELQVRDDEIELKDCY